MKSRTDRILVGLIVVLGGVLGFVVYPTLEQKVVQAGDPAPNFKVVTETGKTITQKDFGGKLLILNFWGSWCQPCVEEAPALNAFSQEMAKHGVVVLGVSIDRNEQLYKQFLKNYNIQFEVARDPEWNINTSYGTFKFPETFFVKDGKVVEKIIGVENWMDPKFLLLLTIAACAVHAEDKKFLPNQASNDDVELFATVILNPTDMQQALGAELPAGYVLVRVKVTPKIGKPMRISADDFTLLSRKDGERSSALAPSQIAGRGAMVVHAAAKQPGGLGTVSSGPVWGGLGGAGRSPGGIGNSSSVEGGVSSATIDDGKGQTENPLLAVLKAKILPDVDSKDPVEGLLYFVLEGKKLKPKDLAMTYKGAGGRLVIDFQ